MDTPTTKLGFWEALLLINMTLKLTGHIDWSWILVLWPLWLALLIHLLCLIGEPKDD